MDTTNPTPAVIPAAPAPVKDTLKDTLFKSLQLTVEESPRVSPEPVPDTGVNVPSKIEDFSPSSGSVADVLKELEKANPAPTPAPVPTTAPAPTAVVPTTPEPAPAPTPTTPPVETRKIELPQLPKPSSDDTIIPPPPNPFDLNGLDDDEVNEVQNAVFAEQRYPEKYQGLGKRVFDFIKNHKAFVRQQEQSDPNVSFDNDNAAYQKFLQQNRPNLTTGERKRLERERLLEEAAAFAERKMSAKSKRLEDELVKLKAEPLVQKTVKDYEAMVKDFMPKEDDPIVIETAELMKTKAVDAGREFLLLANNLSTYDSKNDTHKWLGEFIQEQGELYVKSNHQSLKRGGRSFVPRAQYNALPAEQRAKHFTFTDEDVLQLIAVNAGAAAKYHSDRERERLKKAGYSRTPITPAPTPSNPPLAPVEPSSSPRAASSVAPAAPTVPDNRQGDPFLRFLGNR